MWVFSFAPGLGSGLLALVTSLPTQSTLVDVGLTLDTVWLMTATVLVFFMQLGFAFLEGGLVRSKNTVNVIMKNFTDMAFGAVAFAAVGFGLLFGTNPTGFFGTDLFFFQVGSEWDLSVLFFQMMFAATAATIVSGAIAERVRFGPYIACSVFITALIYPIFGSWAWESLDGQTEGWLASFGFLDFAGSTVVHSVGGWCALAGLVVLGPRLGRFAADGTVRRIPGHNLPLVAGGGFILWLGWFGFNGGSGLHAGADLGRILLNTHLAGSGGVIGALFFLAISRKPVLMTTTVNGALAGLVSITAGCATSSPPFALLIGFVGGCVMVLAEAFLERLGIDDAVGAVAVHGFGGAWGTVAAGLFIEGNLLDFGQAGVQLLGVVTAFLWVFPSAWLCFKVVNKFSAVRASSLHEQRGLDFTEHYELGYPEFQEALHGGQD